MYGIYNIYIYIYIYTIDNVRIQGRNEYGECMDYAEYKGYVGILGTLGI